jgi:hypothetical protein
MAKVSARDMVVVAFAVGFSVAAVNLLGDHYLRPLPIWLKLALAVAGCCVIAALPVYGRRLARHSLPPR